MTNVYQDFQGGYYMDEAYAEPAYDAVDAPMGTFDDEGHLAVEDLYGVQTATFVATIKGSLEEFANNPERAVWQLPAEAHRFLQKVTTNVNRTQAEKEHLVGDLSRAIVLGAKVTDVRNEFPVDIGMDLQGLVPRELTGQGRHNFVIFADTKPTAIERNIFEPDSIFNKFDYVKYGKLTPDALAKEITFPKDDEEYADVKIGGIAWDLLIRNAAADHYEDAVADELLKVNNQIQQNPFMRKVQVPVDIGRELHDGIMTPLNKIDKSFHDLRTTKVRFMREDGEAWNSFSSLVGDAIGLTSADTKALSDFQLVRESRCSAKIELQYGK